MTDDTFPIRTTPEDIAAFEELVAANRKFVNHFLSTMDKPKADAITRELNTRGLLELVLRWGPAPRITIKATATAADGRSDVLFDLDAATVLRAVN